MKKTNVKTMKTIEEYKDSLLGITNLLKERVELAKVNLDKNPTNEEYKKVYERFLDEQEVFRLLATSMIIFSNENNQLRSIIASLLSKKSSAIETVGKIELLNSENSLDDFEKFVEVVSSKKLKN